MNIGVAIIEDDAGARQILANWISQAKGFHCVSKHESSATALAQLPQERPAIVLVDINLPGLNGIQCVNRLKPLMPETQFVMLTVYEDADHIFDALAAGATGYLLKETDRNELINSLKQVHDGGSPMSSYIARKVVQSFQRPRPDKSASESLSARERNVLELLANGYYYQEIADALHISVHTVNTYIRRIYDKLHVRSRGEAVARYAPFTIRRHGPPMRDPQ